MTIKAIISDKGDEMVAIDQSASLADAAALLRKHRIGALMVRDGDTPDIGIISERDIIRAIAAIGGEAVDGLVADYMIRDYLTVNGKTTVEKAMELMTENRVRHLPVTRGARVCGMVSIGDLVNYRIRQSEREAEALRDYIKTG